MGSESFSGCSGGVRPEIAAEEAEVQKLDGVSTGIKRPFDKWTSMAGRKDEICAVNSSAIASWNNATENGLNRNVGQQSSLRGKETFDGHNFVSTDANLARIAGVESRLMLKPRKMGRNTAGSSKGLRMLQVDGSISKTGEDDARSVSIELSSNPASCNNGEGTQMSKQRINSSGKRGDKRNGKVPKGNFSLKNGLISFSSAAGGQNFLGLYGLKSDALDVAENVEDMPLNELLDGSYKSPLLTKDKEKKTLNSNESLLNVIRNACSQLQRPVQARSCSDDDDKITEPKHTSSAIETDGNKGDASTSNASSNDKETCGKLKTVETSDNPPLYKPMDILKRIALPPSKDLDALLLDATKPTSSRNTPDPRLGKPASQRTGLAPFPWSHGCSGNHKSGPDAAKLSTSRTTCQAKWARMKNTSTPQEGCSNFAVDLQSLTYDHSLVPSGGQPSGLPESGNQILHSSGGQNIGPTESGNQSLVPSGGQTSGPSDKGNAPLIPDSFTSCKRVFSSFAACSTSQVSSGIHGMLIDEPSPRCLTAAQTLCEIATQSVKHNTNGTVKCIKKPTQKSSRAPKLKLNEKSEKPFAAPKIMGSDNMIRVSDGTLPSKKPKLLLGAEINGTIPRNFDRKGPTHWSAPRSVRSSPNKCFKDTTAETKGQNSSFVDKLYMMPPPARMKDKGSSSQQKPRKVLSGEWNHSSSKMD